MKAKDLLNLVLYYAQDTKAKGIFENIYPKNNKSIKAMFGSETKVIEGKLEEEVTYLYDYSSETEFTAKVVLIDKYGEKIYLTPIED